MLSRASRLLTQGSSLRTSKPFLPSSHISSSPPRATLRPRRRHRNHSHRPTVVLTRPMQKTNTRSSRAKRRSSSWLPLASPRRPWSSASKAGPRSSCALAWRAWARSKRTPIGTLSRCGVLARARWMQPLLTATPNAADRRIRRGGAPGLRAGAGQSGNRARRKARPARRVPVHSRHVAVARLEASTCRSHRRRMSRRGYINGMKPGVEAVPY